MKRLFLNCAQETDVRGSKSQLLKDYISFVFRQILPTSFFLFFSLSLFSFCSSFSFSPLSFKHRAGIKVFVTLSPLKGKDHMLHTLDSVGKCVSSHHWLTCGRAAFFGVDIWGFICFTALGLFKLFFCRSPSNYTSNAVLSIRLCHFNNFRVNIFKLFNILLTI